ncbi:spindle assembly checkpoint component [Clonorchis sinensis]|uniref:Spindle assembly checkpoint component n=1 Tax=Clonorchis sinensis TaxID=79923 RepID=G7Y7Z6_CLOSI|nr:spindle assembly checkpoint component [Clonorchis sinensis]
MRHRPELMERKATLKKLLPFGVRSRVLYGLDTGMGTTTLITSAATSVGSQKHVRKHGNMAEVEVAFQLDEPMNYMVISTKSWEFGVNEVFTQMVPVEMPIRTDRRLVKNRNHREEQTLRCSAWATRCMHEAGQLLAAMIVYIRLRGRNQPISMSAYQTIETPTNCMEYLGPFTMALRRTTVTGGLRRQNTLIYAHTLFASTIKPKTSDNTAAATLRITPDSGSTKGKKYQLIHLWPCMVNLQIVAIHNASALSSEMRFLDLNAAFKMTCELQQHIVNVIFARQRRMTEQEIEFQIRMIKPEPGDRGLETQDAAVPSQGFMPLDAPGPASTGSSTPDTDPSANTSDSHTTFAPEAANNDATVPTDNVRQPTKRHRLVALGTLHPDLAAGLRSPDDLSSQVPCTACHLRVQTGCEAAASMACPACPGQPAICSAQCFRWWHNNTKPANEIIKTCVIPTEVDVRPPPFFETLNQLSHFGPSPAVAFHRAFPAAVCKRRRKRTMRAGRRYTCNLNRSRSKAAHGGTRSEETERKHESVDVMDYKGLASEVTP